MLVAFNIVRYIFPSRQHAYIACVTEVFLQNELRLTDGGGTKICTQKCSHVIYYNGILLFLRFQSRTSNNQE